MFATHAMNDYQVDERISIYVNNPYQQSEKD